MLLEFKTKNYKSFVDEMNFVMIPAPKQKGLDYSVQLSKIGSKNCKSLCSAVVYGPNASGKTNIIGAMDTLKAIVMRGNIKNADMPVSMNAASSFLELIPNCDSGAEPVSFSIKFIENDMLIEYLLVVDLGSFLDKNYSRKILKESLYVNEKLVFSRTDKLDIVLPACIKSFLNSNIKTVSQQLKDISVNSLNDDELFLNNGFKNIFAKQLVALILGWFEKKFIVIIRSDAIKIMKKMDSNESAVYIEKTLTDASKIFGINSNALGYKTVGDGEDAVLCSIFKDKKALIPAEQFESYGTIRFINEFPLVINVLKNGGTLVMDEFDASIHPMALMNIINIFHNDEININKAQLIFNTHNPIFLEASLYRRDEIKFVERDEETGHSVHYALSDFRTADGIRKGEDYMNNYFVSRYGAIKDVDFSDFIAQIIMENGDGEND